MPNLAGRMLAWATKLGGYDIQYEDNNEISIFADSIAKFATLILENLEQVKPTL